MIDFVIFDWKRTLYDPDKKKLLSGANELLVFLYKKHIPLILIGKGGKKMVQEVEKLGVKKFFKKIIFADEKKDIKYYLPFVSKDSPKKTFIVGDRVRSEIEMGNKLGATTVWFKKGKFSKEDPLNIDQQPSIIVSTFKEIKKIIAKSVSNEKK